MRFSPYPPPRRQPCHRVFRRLLVELAGSGHVTYAEQPAGFAAAVREFAHRLTWMIQWEDEADREHKWGAFTTDPEWLEGRAKSELPENGGPIVVRVTNTIMTGTDYSPLK